MPAPAAPVRTELAIEVDVEGLRHDVAGFGPEEWVPHFNQRYYEGEWSGVALRAVGGRGGQLYPDPASREPFADTPQLARCAHVRSLLAGFGCPLLSVRFLRLGAGASIREHRDLNLGFEDGEVRVHVPVTTGPDVEFRHDGEPVEMGLGRAWYLDLNRPHSASNRGRHARVHLVIDCTVNAWLADMVCPANR
ncbi:MAG: aspartyl/asparaginyl beta-hydroxylase domain-containing protein [Acidimicrobiia bacterium]